MHVSFEAVEVAVFCTISEARMVLRSKYALWTSPKRYDNFAQARIMSLRRKWPWSKCALWSIFAQAR